MNIIQAMEAAKAGKYVKPIAWTSLNWLHWEHFEWRLFAPGGELVNRSHFPKPEDALGEWIAADELPPIPPGSYSR